MDTSQSKLFEIIKQQSDPLLSVVDVISNILNVSKESTYRRIRGETELTLEETRLLCHYFNISIDQLLGTTHNLICFQKRILDRDNFNLGMWLTGIHEVLNKMASFQGEKELIYFARDLPVFYFFDFPALSSFKMYFWMKNLLNYPEYQKRKFEVDTIPKELVSLGKRIWESFLTIPSTEFWTEETMNVTLKHILYCYDCDNFNSPAEALQILDEFQQLVDHLEVMLQAGYKHDQIPLTIYRNDVLTGDNSILIKMGDLKTVYMTQNTFDLFCTTDEHYTGHTESFLRTMMNKSTLISGSGEKERKKFINNIRRKIQQTRNLLEVK